MAKTSYQRYKSPCNLYRIFSSKSGYLHLVRKSIFLLLMFVSALFQPELCGGEILLSLSKPNEFFPSRLIRLRRDGSLLVRRPDLKGRKKIPVSPDKRYRVSCDIRTLGTPSAQVRIGIAVWSKKLPVNISSVLPVKGTETELVRPCQPNDTVIYLKDCSKWQQLSSCIAFDVDPDGLERDIPNPDLLQGQVIKWTKHRDGWEVTLNAPVQAALEKGVCVRQHIYGSPAILSPPKKISPAWQTIDFVIGPGAAAGAEDKNKLFKGVTHAAFMLQCPVRILIKNIKIEEL